MLPCRFGLIVFLRWALIYVTTYLNVLIEESWWKLISIGHELEIAQFWHFVQTKITLMCIRLKTSSGKTYQQALNSEHTAKHTISRHTCGLVLILGTLF